MRRGFTLVELLVVISIIVILLALLVPGLEKALASSQKSKCGSNLHAVGRGLATYLGDSVARRYPGSTTPYSLFGKKGEPMMGTENPHQMDGYDSDKRPLNPYLGITAKGSDVKVARCPSDAGSAIIDPDGDETMTTTTTPGQSNDPSGTGLLDQIFPPTPPMDTTTTTGAGGLGTNNVYNTQGTSYASLAYGKHFGMDGVFGGTKMQASAAKPPATKVMAGDTPMQGDHKYASDRRHRWHEQDKTRRSFNLLFADSHVEFYVFKNNAAGEPEIEKLAFDAAGNPSRGYW